MAEHDDGLDRRVTMLEQQYAALQVVLQRVETEQGNMKEVLRSRFDALSKGQELLATKVDGFRDLVNRLAGDASETPAGRAIEKALGLLISDVASHASRLDSLRAFQDSATGALWLIRVIGVTALLMALVGLLKGSFAP